MAGTAITGIKFAPAAAALVVITSLLLAACGGGGGGGTTPAPIVPATPTASPTVAPTTNPQAFTCPATGAPNSIARSGSSGAEATARMFVRLPAAGSQPTRTNTLLAVSYARSAVASNLQQIAAREQALGASFVRSYDYPQQNLAMRVISVPTASLATTEAALRSQSGVQSIGVTGQRRFRTTSNALYTNDPYFQGFAPNFEIPPYAESSSVPGQWDMHAIGLEHAYGYSQLRQTASALSNPNALGSSTIKIAIIDTGEDASHPELAPKIGYQKCFITNAAGTSQSTGNFSTDEDGHGTDVSGIAAAASNNNARLQRRRRKRRRSTPTASSRRPTTTARIEHQRPAVLGRHRRHRLGDQRCRREGRQRDLDESWRRQLHRRRRHAIRARAPRSSPTHRGARHRRCCRRECRRGLAWTHRRATSGVIAVGATVAR